MLFRSASLCNQEMVDLERVESEEDKAALQSLLQQHRDATGSVNATRVLENWGSMLPKFVKVMPRDYKRVLAERRARGSGAAFAGAAG